MTTDYEGGYYGLHTPIINVRVYPHSSVLEGAIPHDVLTSLSRVQETRWTINGFVHDVLSQAWADGLAVGGIPSWQDLPLPTRIPNQEWYGMPLDDRRRFKNERSAIYGANARSVSHRLSLLRKLAVVDDLGAAMAREDQIDAFYFPHNLDFRGRFYPLPQDLNPQVDDTGRALLMFRDGKMLDDEGGYWLRVHAANCWGNDKELLDARVSWIEDNWPLIEGVVENPLHDLRWAEADKPWQFLAAANELVTCVRSCGRSHAPSHLPVHVDGTCNGLQHLAALGLDPIGALATNLTRDPERQDVYAAVAARTEEVRRMDASKGSEHARNWDGHITRSVVKRAVMTVPYGITPVGMRDQILEDRHVEGLEGSPMQNATYLRDAILAGMEGTITGARDIMQWLQGVAKAKAEAGEVMGWTAPSGFRVEQAYWRMNRKRVQTLLGGGRWAIQAINEDKGLDRRKQYLAAAPNVIHSFDAAHLTATVNQCYDRGLRAFSVIHDSFGVHGSDVKTLQHALRETFVHIYSQNWLRRLQADFDTGECDLPAVPGRGTFDIGEVFAAEYFFS